MASQVCGWDRGDCGWKPSTRDLLLFLWKMLQHTIFQCPHPHFACGFSCQPWSSGTFTWRMAILLRTCAESSSVSIGLDQFWLHRSWPQRRCRKPLALREWDMHSMLQSPNETHQTSSHEETLDWVTSREALKMLVDFPMCKTLLEQLQRTGINTSGRACWRGCREECLMQAESFAWQATTHSDTVDCRT